MEEKIALKIIKVLSGKTFYEAEQILIFVERILKEKSVVR